MSIITLLFSQVYFIFRNIEQINKILQSIDYFVNFIFYRPRDQLYYVNTKKNSNIQSSKFQVKQVSLQPDKISVIFNLEPRASGRHKEKG